MIGNNKNKRLAKIRYVCKYGNGWYNITFYLCKEKILDFKNAYLVVSFLTGFSIMEFLKMLRRVSKIMFEGKPKSA